MLEHESGYQLEVAPIADFESAILGARWDEAVGLMEALGLVGSAWEAVSRHPSALLERLYSGRLISF